MSLSMRGKSSGGKGVVVLVGVVVGSHRVEVPLCGT